MYFVNEYEKELLEHTNGSPNYFPMMLDHAMNEDMQQFDIVFQGNLMTEFMDTGEYRWYEGSNVNKALLGKEMLLPLVKKEYYSKVKDKLNKIFTETKKNQLIVERKRARFLQYDIRKKFAHWNYPATEQEILDAVFSTPFKERVGSRMCRKMLQKLSPELYQMPSARSPFSLRYPLWVHQAYQKATKRKIGKGLENQVSVMMKKNFNMKDLFGRDIDILDKKQINYYLSDKVESKQNAQTIVRLLNLKKWIDFNG
jgi:hypothetical protein